MATPAPVVQTKTPEITKDGPVRKFSDAAIQGHIDRAMAIIPKEGNTAAVVFEGKVGPDGKPEVGIAFLGRKELRDGTLTWEVAGVAQWNGKLEAGAKARVAYVW